jgi:hypothetical protein
MPTLSIFEYLGNKLMLSNIMFWVVLSKLKICTFFVLLIFVLGSFILMLTTKFKIKHSCPSLTHFRNDVMIDY